jgi:SAM-dependent MidA family methyltransferase
MSVATDLPEPSAVEAEHSGRLAERIRAEIARAGGWISFARFMAMALYEPGLGYYSAGASKLGPAGDFITAPEVAPVFSRCLATQCVQVLHELGGGDVLELGAGSGAMAAGMLAELERVSCLPRHYRILDVSADLRERQRDSLERAVPHLLERVEWLDRLPEEGITGMVVANEVLDAMPVERFVVRGGDVNSLGVSWHFGRFELAETRAAPELRERVRRIESDIGRALPDGYVSEVNLGLEDWLPSVAACLRRGVLLFVDYGLPRREYYSAERTSGTLLCHYRHRFHDDPLLRLGLQDITAWVDFTSVAEAARVAGLEIAGYTTQAHFLIGCGIGECVANVAELDLVQRVNLSRQAMLLTLPGEMGERFKAIALARDLDLALCGFSVRDLRHTL